MYIQYKIIIINGHICVYDTVADMLKPAQAPDSHTRNGFRIGSECHVSCGLEPYE